MGIYYKGKQDLKQAEQYLLESLEMVKKLYGTTPNIEVSTTLNEIGIMNIQKKDFKKAEDYIQQSLQILKSIYKDQPNN